MTSIRIPSVSKKIRLTISVFFLLIVAFGIYVYAEKQIDRANERRQISYQLADQLRHSSDELTKMARAYVATRDPRYKKYYQDILDIRDGKKLRPEKYFYVYWDMVLANTQSSRMESGQAIALLDLMRQSGFTGEELDKLAEAKAGSDGLVTLEFEAMRLAESVGPNAEAKRKRAVLMLHDENYHQAKAAIMQPINDFFHLMDKRTIADVHRAENIALMFRILFITIALCAIFMLLKTYEALRAILGGSADEVYANMSRIGRGDFSTSITVAPGKENSVLAGLSEMQRKLQAHETERRQAEESLRRSETKLRTLYESTSDAVLLVGEKNFLDCNRAALAMFGCATKEEFCTKHPADISPPEQPCGGDSRTLADRNNATAIEKGSNHFEWVCRRIDTGETFPAEVLLNKMELDGKTVLQASVRDITKRKQVETDLRASSDRLKEAQHIAQIGNWFLDVSSGKLIWSDEIFRLFEIDPSRFPATYAAFLSAVHPDDRDMVNRAYTESLIHRTPYEISHRLLMGDGRIKWVHEKCITEFDAAGKPLRSLGTVQDITERKQAEDALRKLSLAVEQSPSSIVITDFEANIEYVNQAFVNETGYSLSDVMGQNPRILNSGKNSKATYEEMWSYLTCGKAWRGELINRRKDGSEYIEFVQISPVQQADGKPTHYLAIKENINERKNNEAKIERLSRTYRLLSRVNEAIVRVRDRNELFTAICDAAIESGLFRFVWIGMLDGTWVIPVAHAGVEEGYLSEKFNILLDDERTGNGPTGRAIREGAHIVCQDIENDPCMTPWRDEAIRRGFRSSAAFPVREKGGIVGAINVYSAELHFFTPDIIRLMMELAADVSFSLDVFAEKERRKQMAEVIIQLNTELEYRVQERTRQLEAANKELEAFSYSVSHDLRAPLRSIDGFSRVLSKKYHDQLDAIGQDWLERICHASQHMGLLIDDILQLSLVARSPLRRGLADLSKIAENVADGLRRTNPERQASFVVQQGLSVQADPGLLRIVMDNLLGNAYKFTGKKSDAKIEFGECDIEGERVFFVRDNGDGFNMDYVHKLFGAFQRLHTANEFEGTGIGLATVQRIINRHNGRVWAEAIEGQGAAFYFTLPQRERGGGAC